MDTKPLLVALLAATTASAGPTFVIGDSTLVPRPAQPDRPPRTQVIPLAAEPAVIANEQGLAANERVVAPERRAAAAPPEATRSERRITVERPRLTPDQRIQADVIEVIARTPNLAGRIGVVSEGAVVTLTGWTSTPGMAWRAGRDARGVQGVRHVVNRIRPRVGAITS